jgi:short-subunit dehydrogenase
MSLNPKITTWAGKRVWLLGASSGIGAALARALQARGAHLALSGRHADKLAALQIPFARLLVCDAANNDSMRAARAQLLAEWAHIDLVIYLAGDYAPMGADTIDVNTIARLLDVNYLGAARLAASVLPDLGAGGGIAFVASVAGYRGLPRALAYGPGKAALINFAECLYLDLTPKQIGVWLIDPGFVATPLTAQNEFAMPALISAETAADAVLAGFASGAFELHFPKRFTLVMKLLALLPYRWYFPLIRRITGG